MPSTNKYFFGEGNVKIFHSELFSAAGKNGEGNQTIAGDVTNFNIIGKVGKVSGGNGLVDDHTNVEADPGKWTFKKSSSPAYTKLIVCP